MNHITTKEAHMKKQKQYKMDDFHIKNVVNDVLTNHRKEDDDQGLLDDMESMGYYDDLPDSDRAMTKNRKIYK